MALTETQRANRRSRFFSTDMAALLGLVPESWGTGADVIAEKLYDFEPRKTTEAMELGIDLEPVRLKSFEEEAGPLLRNPECLCEDHPLGAHPDAILEATGEPVDVKTSGLIRPLDSSWGAPGTNEVPIYVTIQCTVHLICAKCVTVCHVPAILGGRGRCLYQVPWDEETAAGITEAADFCWEEYVVARKPFHGPPPSLDLLKRLKRTPKKIVPMSMEAVEAWQDAKAKFKAAETHRDECQAAVIERLGDAEAGSLPDGRLLTYYSQTSQGIDVKRLRADMPTVAAEYTRVSTFPVLRLPKSPKRSKS